MNDIPTCIRAKIIIYAVIPLSLVIGRLNEDIIGTTQKNHMENGCFMPFQVFYSFTKSFKGPKSP